MADLARHALVEGERAGLDGGRIRVVATGEGGGEGGREERKGGERGEEHGG
jgi:hypothetical protein